MKRRSFLEATLAGAAMLPALARGQELAPAEPRDWSGQTPLRYPDPDLVAVDDRFRRYILFNTPIRRHYTGSLWAEGPAWNGVGRYVVWSDIPNNRQLRWLEDDNEVTVFRSPSGNSNGNTFDAQGRQISCEHGGRRVVRYEYDGSVTVIADSYEGRPLNSPNDAVVHPDGSIWFTDPLYGIRGDYEGFRAEQEQPLSVYRVDGNSGQINRATDDIDAPNGLCFSPDYSLLYVANTGAGRTSGCGKLTAIVCAMAASSPNWSIPLPATALRPTACAAMSTATSGPALGPAYRSSRRTATPSASFVCLKSAPMSASAAPSATACS